MKIAIPKTPENSDDESSEDPNEPDKNNRKKMLFVGLTYVAAISFIAIECYVYYKYK